MGHFRLPLVFLVITALVAIVFLFFSGERTALDFSSDQGKSRSDDSSKDSPPATESLPSNDKTISSEDVFLEILPSDCENECALFSSEKDKERYCRNICGLAAENNDTTSAAPYQESVERKDAAIKNQDLGACSNITDANLRKSCEVRVTEDLLE